MEHITPISTDAMGVTSFEKLENIPIEIPDTTVQKPAQSHKCKDKINFSRPMKKHLIKKRSYFKKAPSVQEQQKIQQNRFSQSDIPPQALQ